MSHSEDEQIKDAQKAYKHWAKKGTLPVSYIRSVLGEEMRSISPGEEPLCATEACNSRGDERDG